MDSDEVYIKLLSKLRVDSTLPHVYKYQSSPAQDNTSCSEVKAGHGLVPSSLENDGNNMSSVKCLKTTKFPSVESLTVFPLVSLNIKGRSVHALIDFCSEVSLITRRAFKLLKLKSKSREPFLLEGSTGISTLPLDQEAELILKGL